MNEVDDAPAPPADNGATTIWEAVWFDDRWRRVRALTKRTDRRD